MSYQLIYTSAPELLEPGQSGYGVVAQSTAIPRSLAKRLIKLSVYKEEHKLISGPQFAYNILDCAGATFHVLSSVQSAGADYTGRECHIAHHLALTKEEVRSLKSSKARPTPAAIILGLYTDQFWKPRWEGPAGYIETEPQLSTSMLPELEQQTTWKELTGHKYNAKALITPPYEHDCLIIVQSGTRSLDVLHLLAESDWLSPSRGWGITFTTTGYAQDTFALTQRIAVIEESMMAAKARRSGRPILKLEHKLLISRTELIDAPSAPQRAHSTISSASDYSVVADPATPRRSPKKAALTSLPDGHQLTQAPYKYQEALDEQTYFPPKKPCSRKRHYALFSLLIALGCLGAIGIIYLTYEQKVPHPALAGSGGEGGYSTGQEPLPPLYPSLFAQSIKDIELINQQFLRLAELHYDHDQASEKLQELSSLCLASSKQASPEIANKLLTLHSILHHLQQSDTQCAAHIDMLRELMRYCQEMQLDSTSVARFYFQHITHPYTPNQWAGHFSEREGQALLHILKTGKHLNLFNDPQLYAYLCSLDRHDPINRHYINTPQRYEDILAAYAHLNEGALLIINEGQSIPLIIQNIFQHAPFTLDQGKLSVYPITSPELSHQLQRDKYTVIMDGSTNSKIKSIKLFDEGKPVENNTMELQADTRFYRFNYQGEPTVLRLKLSAAPMANHYLFVPRIRRALKSKTKHFSIPALTKEAFLIEEDDLESIPPDSWQPFAQLRLSNAYRQTFPWKIVQTNLELDGQSHIELPSFSGYTNEIRIDAKSPHLRRLPRIIHHTLDISKLPHAPYMEENYRIQLQCNYNFKSLLEREFYTTANSCATHQDSFATGYYSLANVYYLLLAMDEVSSISQAETLMIEYFKLYSNRSFASKINDILSAAPALHLSSDQARGVTTADKAARMRYTEIISSKEMRTLIRQYIRDYLAEQLYKTYTRAKESAERSLQTQPEQLLELMQVEQTDAKLIWHFRLITPAPAAATP